MKSFFKSILTTIISMISSLAIIIILVFGIIAILSSEEEVIIKENSILKIDLTNTSVVERMSENPFDGLNISGNMANSIELRTVLNT